MGRTALFSRHQPGGVFTVDDLGEHPAEIFFVGSTVTGATDGAGYGKNPDAPVATLDYAIGLCTANKGDVIYVLPGHAETLTAAGAVTCDIAGVKIIGLGEGADRPTFTFGTSTAASILISAASVTIRNIVAVCNIDGATNPFHVQAADCTIDVEFRDTSATVEAARAVLTTAAADRLTIKMVYRGQTGGDACVNAIRLVGCDGARIVIDFYGKASTAVVEFLTTACTNIKVIGRFHVSGTSDLSKNVVDTVTGSTWSVEGFDSVAGQSFSGGDAAAVAGDDVSTINAKIGTITNTGGTATIGGVLGDLANDSLVARLNDLGSNVDSTTTDNLQGKLGTDTELADRSLYDILNGGGPAAAAAAAAPANDISLYGVLRELYNQADKSLSTAAAVMANGDTTIFTIAGGPIEVLSLMSVCVTTNDATASTLQYQADPTAGGVTALSIASASLANAAAGTTALCTGTFANAPTVTTDGTVAAGTTKFIVPVGIIKITIATGPTTGTWTHHLRYRPLARGVTVS